MSKINEQKFMASAAIIDRKIASIAERFNAIRNASSTLSAEEAVELRRIDETLKETRDELIVLYTESGVAGETLANLLGLSESRISQIKKQRIDVSPVNFRNTSLIDAGGSSDTVTTVASGKLLTEQEWKNILKLFEDERGWSEEELTDAIMEDGWMNQKREAASFFNAPLSMTVAEIKNAFEMEDISGVDSMDGRVNFSQGKGGRYWFDEDHPITLTLLLTLICNAYRVFTVSGEWVNPDLPISVKFMSIKQAKEVYQNRANGYCHMDKDGFPVIETSTVKKIGPAVRLMSELCLDELEAIYILAQYKLAQRGNGDD